MIQAKHWKESGFEKLLAHLKQTELAKVQALDPEHYMIATSVPMTPGRKQKVYDVFEAYITHPPM